jgi:hypothetical protein
MPKLLLLGQEGLLLFSATGQLCYELSSLLLIFLLDLVQQLSAL